MLALTSNRLILECVLFTIIFLTSSWIVKKSAFKDHSKYLLASVLGAIITYILFLQSLNSNMNSMALDRILQFRSIVVVTLMYVWFVKATDKPPSYYWFAATAFSFLVTWDSMSRELLFASIQLGLLTYTPWILLMYSVYIGIKWSNNIYSSSKSAYVLPLIYIATIWTCSQSSYVEDQIWLIILLYISPIALVLYYSSENSISNQNTYTKTGEDFNEVDEYVDTELFGDETPSLNAENLEIPADSQNVSAAKSRNKKRSRRRKITQAIQDTFIEDHDTFTSLDKMIGMGQVKKQFETILATYELEQAQKENGILIESYGNHMVFYGNPGTGKTTVARIVATILHSKNMIQKSDVIEVTRKDLIGPYIGQSLPMFQQKVEEARGGILFIDEAYTLYQPDSPNDFGHEIIGELLSVLENNRNDLIVIIAGYRNEISQFLASNPGLNSRFNKHIDFPNYTIDDLMQIFDIFLQDNNLTITSTARKLVKESLKQELQLPNFGNARAVRNIFARCKDNLALRLKQSGNIRRYAEIPISDEDVPLTTKA